MKFKLKAQTREISGKKVQKLRNDDFIPAIIYGHKFKNIPLKVKMIEFSELFDKAGETSIIDLEVDKDKVYHVLIYDLLRDPVTDKILHIDFYRIKSDEAITAEIPIIIENVSPAVKDLGGTLVSNLRTVRIKALPKDLPHEIKIDISSLKSFDDQVKVSGLSVPEGVEVLLDPEEVIILVKPPRSQEELEALTEEVKEEVEAVEGVVDKEADEGKEGEAKEEKRDEEPKKEKDKEGESQ